MTHNRLNEETSPYLLQHQHNPVHWYPWSDQAFAIAQSENKPILLSIGYAACHWCHVMAHESFENADIASLMNALFINIKVDREERPDVDGIYQNALALTGQHGGWPLTMFLTPDGKPFWGGTYFPPEERWGRPGFADILRRVADVYDHEQDTIAKNSTALTTALDRLAIPDPEQSSVAIDAGILDQIAQQMLDQVDKKHGGIGQAPKFPQAYALDFLWRAHCRHPNSEAAEAVTHTLKQMCQGGIYDHLGGGFARYSTDDQWLVPHFEKMLYDNAQMIATLSHVWQGTKSPLFETRVRETIAWLEREMMAPDGGFAATLDADSEGVEGKYYVWSGQEIDQILGDDAAFFRQAYGVTDSGNWEGQSILNRSHHLNLHSGDEEDRLRKLRARLLRHRNTRIRPGWDDKVLADWNGLMIHALVRAGLIFENATWIAQAKTAFNFVCNNLRAPSDVSDYRLLHAYRDGRAHIPGMLDDYANMAQAALSLYEADPTANYLDLARAWTESLSRHFWDETHGGYFFTADEASHLVTRQRHCHDNAVPAGNGTMLGVLSRLWHITGDPAYQERAAKLYAAFSGLITKNFFPLTTFLNNTEMMMSALQIVIVGEKDTQSTNTLLRTVYHLSLPNLILQLVSPGHTLPVGHPAFGKRQVENTATAYVCFGNACSQPLTSAQSLSTLLQHQ